MKTVKSLTPNPENPRTISDQKLSQLEKSLKEFGSLDGFVFNTKTGHLISGHQRSKILKDGKIENGFVHWNGEKFPYREVSWSKSKEKLATIAANKTAGDWDMEKLTEWVRDLDLDFEVDLDLSMFDIDERKQFLGADFAPGNANDQSSLDTKNPVICPKCAYEFTP